MIAIKSYFVNRNLEKTIFSHFPEDRRQGTIKRKEGTLLRAFLPSYGGWRKYAYFSSSVQSRFARRAVHCSSPFFSVAARS